jgi:hypothetical protein
LLVYSYNGRSISLNTSQLTGEKFEVSWYNPRDGKTIDTGTVKKNTVPEFDPPGTQKDGEDWVLILKSK